MHARRAFTQICSLATLLGGLTSSVAHAQSYTVSTTSGSFTSIAGSGTALGLAGVDDGDAAFSSPVSFSFFGTTVSAGTSLYASSNGTLSVGTSYTDYSNGSFPTAGGPSRFFAPFWHDMRMPTSSDIYWAQVGSDLVVEWSNVESYSVGGETISFQIRISTTDGSVRYAYGPRSVIGTWSGASIGLEDATESFGASATCTPGCVPADVPSGTVLRFTPGAAPTTPDLVIDEALPPSSTTLTPGATMSIPYAVANIGQGSTGSTRVGLFLGLGPQVTTSDAEVATDSVSSLSSGGSVQGTVTFTVPSNLPPGSFAAALIVDPDNVVSEASEANNTYPLGTYTVGGSSGGITITTMEVPAGTIGIPYDVQIQQSGGTSVSWFLLEGSLPSGLNLTSTGRLQGTPAQEGTFSFTVEAAEEGLSSGVQNLTLTINNGGTGSISVTPNTLPEASVGVPYTAALTAVGGVSPYAFQVISGRPSWLLVSGNGQISGTPDAPGQHSMTVSVFDSEGADSTAVIALSVIESGPLTVVSQIPAAVQGRNYSQRVIRGGRPSYQVTIVDGQFPGSMMIDSSGMLTGTPDRPGNYQVTVQVTDANSPAGSAAGQIVLQVTELRAIEITMSEIVVALRSDIDFPLEVSGGVPPYTWGIAQGSLPGTLQISSEGRLIGQVQEAGTSTVTFTVSDSEGSQAQRAVPLIARGYRNTDPTNTRTTGRDGGCTCAMPVATKRPWFGAIVLTIGLGVGLRRRRHRAARRDGSSNLASSPSLRRE